MHHTPCILALCLACWNFSEYMQCQEPDARMADRVAINVAFAIVIECLYFLSWHIIAWILITPGAFFLIALVFYRLFLGVKDMHIESCKEVSFDFFSGTM